MLRMVLYHVSDFAYQISRSIWNSSARYMRSTLSGVLLVFAGALWVLFPKIRKLAPSGADGGSGGGNRFFRAFTDDDRSRNVYGRGYSIAPVNVPSWTLLLLSCLPPSSPRGGADMSTSVSHRCQLSISGCSYGSRAGNKR